MIRIIWRVTRVKRGPFKCTQVSLWAMITRERSGDRTVLSLLPPHRQNQRRISAVLQKQRHDRCADQNQNDWTLELRDEKRERARASLTALSGFPPIRRGACGPLRLLNPRPWRCRCRFVFPLPRASGSVFRKADPCAGAAT